MYSFVSAFVIKSEMFIRDNTVYIRYLLYFFFLYTKASGLKYRVKKIAQ